MPADRLLGSSNMTDLPIEKRPSRRSGNLWLQRRRDRQMSQDTTRCEETEVFGRVDTPGYDKCERYSLRVIFFCFTFTLLHFVENLVNMLVPRLSQPNTTWLFCMGSPTHTVEKNL